MLAMVSTHGADTEDYELLRSATFANADRDNHTSVHHNLRGFRGLIWGSPPIIIALSLGTAGAAACLGFTYWLSKQVYDCPEWSLYCEVSQNGKWMYERLGQVQGFVSALYGFFIAMLAYVGHRLAETSLWPAMTKRSFRMTDIDYFLEAARGSLPSVPFAIWHAFTGGIYYLIVVLVVGSLPVLLLFTSIFVGHAYTLVRVPTLYFSNHTIGAGTGFAYSPPPQSAPAAVGQANAIYQSWSNAMSVEPMIEQRNFVLDRINISSIGDTSIKAIEVKINKNCSGFPINVDDYGDGVIVVNTTMYGELGVRMQPQLALWVDNYWNLSNTRAVTRLVFAALNGTIEGGHPNAPTKDMTSTNYNGISSLAYDVDVDIVDSEFCMGGCAANLATLSSLETLSAPDAAVWSPPPRVLWGVSVWLAAVTTTYGVSVSETQPLFDKGPILNNTNFSLPVPYTTSTSTSGSPVWSQANLSNFINVASGALGISMTRNWQLNITGNVTVESYLDMPRLATQRTYVLIAPICLSLGAIVVLAITSALLYRSANVSEVRMGKSAELTISTQSTEIRLIVEEVRKGFKPMSALERMPLRYGIVADGHDGLGAKGKVRTFPLR